jgi:hypothetical protein
VLKGLQRVRIRHYDQNNPLRNPNTGGLQVLPSPHGEAGPTLYRSRCVDKSNVVIIEALPAAAIPSSGDGRFGGGGGGGRGRRHMQQSGVQVCFLKEYLLDRSHASVVDILHDGLQYREATPRWIITGGVKQISHKVTEYGHSGTRRVVREFLDARKIVPDPLKLHARVNYFADTDVTDAFVYNRCLGEGRRGRRSFGNSRTDRERQVQQWMAGDIDTKIARRYWSQAGFDYDAERMPEAMRLKILAMMEGEDHCDELGVYLSELHRPVYPDDFIVSERDRGPMVVAPRRSRADGEPEAPVAPRGLRVLQQLQARMMAAAGGDLHGTTTTTDDDQGGGASLPPDDDSSSSSTSTSSGTAAAEEAPFLLDEASVQGAISEHPELMFGGWYLRDVNDAARRDLHNRRRRARQPQLVDDDDDGVDMSGRPRKRPRPTPSSAAGSRVMGPDASVRDWIRTMLSRDLNYSFDLDWSNPDSDPTYKRMVQEVRNDMQRETALAAVHRRQRLRMAGQEGEG